MASRYVAHSEARRKALNAMLTVRSRGRKGGRGGGAELSTCAEDED